TDDRVGTGIRHVDVLRRSAAQIWREAKARGPGLQVRVHVGVGLDADPAQIGVLWEIRQVRTRTRANLDDRATQMSEQAALVLGDHGIVFATAARQTLREKALAYVQSTWHGYTLARLRFQYSFAEVRRREACGYRGRRFPGVKPATTASRP